MLYGVNELFVESLCCGEVGEWCFVVELDGAVFGMCVAFVGEVFDGGPEFMCVVFVVPVFLQFVNPQSALVCVECSVDVVV